MPNWHNVLNELQQMGSTFDVLRRKYIKLLHDCTGRNVICYYSGWLQKKGIEEVAVNDSDKNGLMTVINGLDVSLLQNIHPHYLGNVKKRYVGRMIW